MNVQFEPWRMPGSEGVERNYNDGRNDALYHISSTSQSHGVNNMYVPNQKLTVSGESFAIPSHPKRGAHWLTDIVPHQSMLEE